MSYRRPAPHAPRIIETLREFSVVVKCGRCGKPNAIRGRWIRLNTREVDCEVDGGAHPCLWCQGPGMTNENLPPQYEIPRDAVMSFYEDKMGPIKGQGFLRN